MGGRAQAQLAVPEDSLRPLFRGQAGTFVVSKGRDGTPLRMDAERARRGYLPASTFKIASTLIALETGVASGAAFALDWDSTVAPRQPWWPATWPRDHELRTALPASAVWFYQELARRIGPGRMQRHLDRFAYGNRDMSGGLDRFWLTGGLRISADEQVAFLRRFHYGELGVAPRSTQVVREHIVIEETPAYRLSGKTGWVGFGEPDAPQVGWVVGFVERTGADARAGETYFFAMNLDMAPGRAPAERVAIVKDLLKRVGVL